MSTIDVIIFLAVIVLAQLYKLIGGRYGLPTGKTVITSLLIVLAVVVTWLFGDYALPVCDPADVGVCVANATELIAEVVGASMITYNLILERVFKRVGAEPALG